MRTTTPQKIAELQRNPVNIRNICILAHVDHGKTTLADALVASNGIISQRMAGKLRYLDSRDDEQLRGITMKSSAISLYHNQGCDEYLVNLIDSPGHIDFSSEVSTAVRLCDGAVVLVDVAEGVCPQTHAVLRQAWLDSLRPVLVLNKVDRLVTELRMTPLEAHLHLQQVLEQVNAIMGELFTSHQLEKVSEKASVVAPIKQAEEASSTEQEQVYDWSAGLEDTDDSTLYFSPDQGNVIFASAIDGWGFGINQFAELYAKKLGVNEAALRKTLWGDFYLEGKTKRIKKGAQAKAKKPLFVQFILENLWAVYEAFMIRRDKEMIEKIVKSLNLKIQARDARNTDPRVQLQAACSQWLPLSTAVLAMVVEQLPSPLAIPEERVEKLLCPNMKTFDSLPRQTQTLKDDFMACSPSEEAPVVIFVSKMFAMDKKALPQNRQRPLTQEEISIRREQARLRHAEKLAATAAATPTEDNTCQQEKGEPIEPKETMIQLMNEANKVVEDDSDQVFIAFARVFSGTVKKGKRLYVLGPKHDPSKTMLQSDKEVDPELTLKDLVGSAHITSFLVEDLYLFMGRELELMEEVPAGNVLGIGGLEDHILKSATIADTKYCPPFTDMYFEASPIVRVAVEPANPGDMGALVRGMKLLNQADPCVQILVQETGEHVIIAAGEVHLQKCIDDLRDRYAKIELTRSQSIVPFRETIIVPPKTDMVNEAIEDPKAVSKSKNVEEDEEGKVVGEGLVKMITPNKACTIQIRALPLPPDVVKLLEENMHLTKALDEFLAVKLSENQNHVEKVTKMNDEINNQLLTFKQKLSDAFASGGERWEGAIDKIWSFGPRRNGPNILLNRVEEYNRPSIWSCLSDQEPMLSSIRDYDTSVINGFQLATLSGPLCEEPMSGVCFVIENWDMSEKKGDSKANVSKSLVFKDSASVQDNATIPSIPEAAELDQSTGAFSTQNYLNDEAIFPTGDSDTLEELSISNEAQCDSQCSLDSQLSGATEGLAIRHSQRQDSECSVGSPPATPQKEQYGPFTGQLMSCVKEGCRRAFKASPQRMVWAMYSCVIQATADVLGKMYAVLGKRNGRVLSEEMREGSSVFNINAVLPVVESFGFAEEIRKRTSGLASPQLRFSHWEVIETDPYWVPTTEEEYLHFGEKADSDNIARKYMNSVRRRKGLKVDEKLVEHGEKQRTLTKNK